MSRHLLAPLPLVCSAFGGVVVQAQVGSVLRYQKIDELQGGFAGVLHDGDRFGWSVSKLGDLNADGVRDLAVGAFQDDDGGPDRGAIWILFLNSAGGVVQQQKISQTQGGFAGALPDGARFGREIAELGDLDGDGLPELAATSANPNELWILSLKADGTVKRHTEIRYSDPVFASSAFARDFDDGGLAALGDVDGDGIGDLAVGAPRDDDGRLDAGALWILRLNAGGTPRSAQKISQTAGGFTGILDRDDQFGTWVSALGDLDGDGNGEIAVSEGFRWTTWILFLDSSQRVRQARLHSSLLHGVPFTNLRWTGIGDLDGDGIGDAGIGTPGLELADYYAGGVVVRFLASDADVRKGLTITHQQGGLGPLPDGSYFGYSVAALGDLDGDGGTELAVGAPFDHDIGPDRGAVWILALDPSAVRNGSGTNPLTLSQSADPVLGSPWSASLDCSAHASGLAFLSGWQRAHTGVFLSAGELLVDPSSPKFFLIIAPHAGGTSSFATLVPNDIALLDLQVFIQGLCSGAPGLQLSNALDVILGR